MRYLSALYISSRSDSGYIGTWISLVPSAFGGTVAELLTQHVGWGRHVVHVVDFHQAMSASQLYSSSALPWAQGLPDRRGTGWQPLCSSALEMQVIQTSLFLGQARLFQLFDGRSLRLTLSVDGDSQGMHFQLGCGLIVLLSSGSRVVSLAASPVMASRSLLGPSGI